LKEELNEVQHRISPSINGVVLLPAAWLTQHKYSRMSCSWVHPHSINAQPAAPCTAFLPALLLQVGELFTAQQQQQAVQSPPDSANSTSGSSLLQQVLQEDEADVSELYFGSAEGPAGGSSSPEALSWRQHSETLREQLAPLQQAKVGAGCGPHILLLWAML
jgi:hypothetical protein